MVQRLNHFLKEYDLVHCYDYLYDLFYFLDCGKFYDWRKQINKTNFNKKLVNKNVNNDFYKGFHGES